jgi:cation diffusion facilitator family transporter
MKERKIVIATTSLNLLQCNPMNEHQVDRRFLTAFAWVSITAAILTIGLKTAAYFLTGSVGLLSDALESLVNLVGALMALTMLTIAARPEDEDHAYGHSKAEYFSSGVEGTLILIAAISIIIAAIPRLITPQPIEQAWIGLSVSAGASIVNLIAAVILLRAGKKHNSITLTANAHHLLTDVWTSIGVLIGVGLVAFTGWQRLDPLVALLVAANIIWSGGRIVRESVLGLMDTALPRDEQEKIKQILDSYTQNGVEYHAFRSRQSGARRFVSFHVLVPDSWTVLQGHQLLEKIEADLRRAVPALTVFTHLEPLNDPSSWQDTTLDRHTE